MIALITTYYLVQRSDFTKTSISTEAVADTANLFNVIVESYLNGIAFDGCLVSTIFVLEIRVLTFIMDILVVIVNYFLIST